MERLQKIGRIQPVNAATAGFSRLGIGFEKLDRGAFDPEKAYDLVAGLGVHYVRLQSGWQRTEKVKGHYDFAWLDAIVDQLIARGMEPWIDLCYGNELYTEAAREHYGAVGCAPIYTKEERDAWRAYVQATVGHFSGRVRWYEIWNEADGQWCWKTGVNAVEYGDFAVATANVIHETDPLAKAIGGVTSWINLPYLKVLFDRGVCKACDAISFHRYNADEQDALYELQALRALIDQYDPTTRIIQGESGTQSDSRGAGALSGGAWTPLKQAKYLLRHRLIDLSSEVAFTSYFSAMDMVEALNGKVGDMASYLDYGYFGVIRADFDENGVATGNYAPKLSYRALQHLSALFCGDVTPCSLPLRRVVLDSPRFFGKDASDSRLMRLGFKDGRGAALCYWEAADLMRETFEGTVSFQLAGEEKPPVLADLLNGDVYALPESLLERAEGGAVITLKNLPLTDCPLLLAFGGFGGLEARP